MRRTRRIQPVGLTAGIVATAISVPALAALAGGLALLFIRFAFLMGMTLLFLVATVMGAVMSFMALGMLEMACWHAVGKPVARMYQDRMGRGKEDRGEPRSTKKDTATVMAALATASALLGAGVTIGLALWATRSGRETIELVLMTGLATGCTIGMPALIGIMWSIIQEKYSQPPETNRGEERRRKS